MNSQGFLVVCSSQNYMRYFDCTTNEDLSFQICKDEVFRKVIVPIVNEDYSGNEEWYHQKYLNPSDDDIKRLSRRFEEISEIRIYNRKQLEIGVILQ